jgi:hypothetical protein
VEKFLEVGEQHSIMKTFFVMEAVQKSGIGIAIVALFLLSSNIHKIKIPMMSTRTRIEFEVENFFTKKN